MQVTAGFKWFPVCKDDPLVYDLAYDVRLNTGDWNYTLRGAEEEFKIPSAVEREETPLLHRHPDWEGEPCGIDGKPAIVHGEEIIKRESQPIGYIHHIIAETPARASACPSRTRGCGSRSSLRCCS